MNRRFLVVLTYMCMIYDNQDNVLVEEKTGNDSNSRGNRIPTLR